MNELFTEDFDFEEEDEITSFPCIWGVDEVYTVVDVEFSDDKRLSEDNFDEYLPLINSTLSWLDENKAAFEKALIDGKALELAQVWAASLDIVTIDGVENVDFGEEKIPLPISAHDFFAALEISGIALEIEEKTVGGEVIAEVYLGVYLVTEPDFFSEHSLELSVSPDKKIEFMGLVG